MEVQVAGELGDLPSIVSNAGYRIVQESLTNVIRHAAATQVCLSIEVDAEELRLKLTDNGKGAGEPVVSGSGLAGMKERARLLGGDLTARPRQAGGFEVRAVLPLKESQ